MFRRFYYTRSLFMFIGCLLGATGDDLTRLSGRPSFDAWQQACYRLAHYKKREVNPYQTVLTQQLFTQEVEKYLSAMQKQFKQMPWVKGHAPDLSRPFTAFVQKLVVPTDTFVAFHGDIHGDIHSLNRFIQTYVDRGMFDKKNPFRIKNPNFYIIFLGDYVDRGWYGAEVLYTILRLKNENPDRVFMVRGNHEELKLNTHFGFIDELENKFVLRHVISDIQKVYNSLPVALYLCVPDNNTFNVIQCCHGGIELGFNALRVLDNNYPMAAADVPIVMQRDGFDKLMVPGISSFRRYFKNFMHIEPTNGFMWSDFIVDEKTGMELSERDGKRGTIFKYGKEVTKEFLRTSSNEKYILRSIFRAHQHGDSAMRKRILNKDKLSHKNDKGVGKLWIKNTVHKDVPSRLDDVAVVTFSVTRESGYEWPVHAWGQLHVAREYTDWRLQVLHADS